MNAWTIGHVVRAVEAGLRKHFPDRRWLIAVSDGDATDGTLGDQRVPGEHRRQDDDTSELMAIKSP